MDAYLNAVATATPEHDVHAVFLDFAGRMLTDPVRRALFNRLARRSQIEHRRSVLQPAGGDAADAIDTSGLYRLGAFASTEARMRVYEAEAIDLAARAVDGLGLGDRAQNVTHLIITSCTGFAAPGVDLQLIERCGLPASAERTVVGFMGCYAAISALKLARHIVRSEPAAQVLVVSVELCTLHLQDTADLEEMLSFLVFADGCAAALISADPAGLSLDRFHAVLAPEAADQITWNVRDSGFQMVLSGQVPSSVGAALRAAQDEVLDGAPADAIDLWAVHPGGRSVLDAVESALDLPPEALALSREVLRDNGNMSSATILFVLAAVLRQARPGQRGCAMAFGPGLSAETFLFTAAD